jgi:hypothetical protein
MSHNKGEPKPDGNCVLCQEPISPGWDRSGEMNSVWFCSAKCIAMDWMEWADVPSAYQEFVPSLPSCGPERIRLAEEWMKSHLAGKNDRPGLLLHSVRSGTGKTRVAIHTADARMLVRWPGSELMSYRMEKGSRAQPVLWLNARGFRREYLDTMHCSQASERADWVTSLCLCHLLILDDADKLKVSEGLLEVLYSVLDERFSNNKLTILTANTRGPDLERKWGPQYGPYLVRRVRDFCLAINFDP